MKKISLALSILFFLLWTYSSFAQILKPVKWSYSSERTSENEAVLILTAQIEKGWHLYSQNKPENGPVPTSFKFNKTKDFDIVGKVTEGKPIEIFDQNFQIKVKFFAGSAVFKQKIKLNNNSISKVTGTLEFMVCDDHQCLPPEEQNFEIPIKKGVKLIQVEAPPVLKNNDSADKRIPGTIAPPKYSPCLEITSKVMAVPRSTTINGLPYNFKAA